AVARERFAEAGAALLELPAAARRRLLPARIMGVVYRDLLRRLEARGGGLDGALGGARVRVPRARKLWLAAAAMIRAPPCPPARRARWSSAAASPASPRRSGCATAVTPSRCSNRAAGSADARSRPPTAAPAASSTTART